MSVVSISLHYQLAVLFLGILQSNEVEVGCNLVLKSIQIPLKTCDHVLSDSDLTADLGQLSGRGVSQQAHQNTRSSGRIVYRIQAGINPILNRLDGKS